MEIKNKISIKFYYLMWFSGIFIFFLKTICTIYDLVITQSIGIHTVFFTSYNLNCTYSLKFAYALVQLKPLFFSMYISTLCRKKNAFPCSNDVIIIAQAGATFTTRGITPANTPRNPFCWKIFHNIDNVPTFGNDFTGLSAYRTFSPNSICLWVLTTSNGAVVNAAICRKFQNI